jgi:hypothetical protein
MANSGHTSLNLRPALETPLAHTEARHVDDIRICKAFPGKGKLMPDNSWISQGGARVDLEDGRSSDWDSERDLSDLEPMEGLTEDEIDEEEDDWTKVRHRKWGGNAGSSQSLKLQSSKSHAGVFVQRASGKGDGKYISSAASTTTTSTTAASTTRTTTTTTTSASPGSSRAGQCGAELANGRPLRGAPFGKGSGKRSKPVTKSPFADHKCVCDKFNGEYFCSSTRCRNNAYVNRPLGSTTNGRVGTEDGSPWNT